jgi:SAM-dependent methyltransferase
MSIQVESCPLCGGAQSRLFDQRTFRGQQVVNRVCRTCGLVYQSPRMSDVELEEFYAKTYRQLYQGRDEPDVKDLAVQRGRAQALLAFTHNLIASVSRHLDIGCSAGVLLQEFSRAYGCQPVGIEPGDAYRCYAQAAGLPVFASLDDLQSAKPAAFDLISLAHVLEHLPAPVEYLTALRADLLALGGCLLVEVPNLYSHEVFETAHLVAYSPHTLQQTLRRSGFDVIGFQQHGQPRSETLPLYLTVLARPAAAPLSVGSRVSPERFVRLKRQLGMLRRRLLTRLNPRRAWLTAPGA